MNTVRAPILPLRYYLALISFLIGGCGAFGYQHRLPYDFVEIYPGTSTGFQLRIPYRVEGQGNIHDPFSFKKYEYPWADWISISASGGTVAIEGGEITTCPEGKAKPHLYGTIRIRGKVVFSDSKVKLKLQVPDHDSVWTDYRFNGEYRLESPSNSPSETKHPSAAECMR